jgi:hypothetical protein
MTENNWSKYSFVHEIKIKKFAFFTKKNHIVMLPNNISQNLLKLDLTDNVEINFSQKKYVKCLAHLDIQYCYPEYKKYIITFYNRKSFLLSEVLITMSDMTKNKAKISISDNLEMFLDIILSLHIFFQGIKNYDDVYRNRKYLHGDTVKHSIKFVEGSQIFS